MKYLFLLNIAEMVLFSDILFSLPFIYSIPFSFEKGD